MITPIPLQQNKPYDRLNPDLDAALNMHLDRFPVPISRGAVWTTDAPYRETQEAIESARAEGILAVEMEAASLYSFAEARQQPVVCFAHVTNRMGIETGDFEKGEADGSVADTGLARRQGDPADAPPGESTGR